MRRLIFTLAAGLLAGGTALTGGIASASTTAAGGIPSAGKTAIQTGCTPIGTFFFNVTKSGVNYFLGTPNNLVAGKAAVLKPKQNMQTGWALCESPTATLVLQNRGLALTTRSASSGADVTLETPGNSGSGFASQQWEFSATSNTITFQNVKTGQFLRVRNNGPIMGQAVTTGLTSTTWTYQ